MYPFTETGGQTRLPSVCNISTWYYQVVREEHRMQYDLIIRHAHLHRRDGLVDIAVNGGQFARIANELCSDSAIHEIDVASRLVSRPYVDAHVHLDAVLTVRQPRYDSSGT